MLEFVYCIHIVTSALSSYHWTEINDVHIIDSSMCWLVPSKKDSLLFIDCCKCEVGTWWWPWSSGGRGGPLACKRWSSTVFTLIPRWQPTVFFCDSESIYLVTHSLRSLLTKLAAFSLYNLDPNGLGILMLTFQKPSVQYRSTSVHLDIECIASSWLLLCLSLMKSFTQSWTYAHVNHATMVTHPHAFHLGISVGRRGAYAIDSLWCNVTTVLFTLTTALLAM